MTGSFEKVRKKLLKEKKEEEEKETKLVKKIGKKGEKKKSTKKKNIKKIPKDMNSNEIQKTLEKIKESGSLEEANETRKNMLRKRDKLLNLALKQKKKFEKKGIDTSKMDEKIEKQKEALEEAQKASEKWLKEKSLKKKT